MRDIESADSGYGVKKIKAVHNQGTDSCSAPHANEALLTRRAMLALGAACSVGVVGDVLAQTRHLSLIVPQPAGNPTDATARKLQPVLQRELDQAVVIENVPGAGGSLGIRKVLQAPSEAPMLLIASQTEPVLTPLALASARYKPEEFRAIALVARAPYVLVGRRNLEATNLAELMDLGRRGGGAMTHGHIGQGSMIHLLGEQWSRKTGQTLTQVTYRGVPPIVQDLMGGQIDLSFIPMAANASALIETGKVRAYGITAPVPMKRFPTVLPLARLDERLTDFVYDTWSAVFVSRKTSEAVVQRLQRAVNAALKDAEVVAYITSGGLNPAPPMTLAELDHFYQAETRRYQLMAREIGITQE